MLLVIFFDYRSAEEKAAVRAKADGATDDGTAGGGATSAEADSKAGSSPDDSSASGADTAAQSVGNAASEADAAAANASSISQSRVEELISGLGGRDNVGTIDSIATARLRVEVQDSSLVDIDALNSAGIAGAVEVLPGVWHIILGQEALAFAETISAG